MLLSRTQTAGVDGALNIASPGGAIGVDGRTRTPGTGGAGVADGGVAAGAWVVLGVWVSVEPQPLARTAINATVMASGAGFDELRLRPPLNEACWDSVTKRMNFTVHDLRRERSVPTTL
jgi:hypothetical protein